ncbi:MAG: leucine-rich repeat protein [Eubacteriales bacterium]|nr:leucine-rich repeat protein [Eubacteriales bacterium]
MRKKAIAILLAMSMAIQPSMVGAAEFTDGEEKSVNVLSEDEGDYFTDDVEEVQEVESVGEGEPTEDPVQIGDNVWVTFDDATGTATISGTGDMWDFLSDGWDITKKHENPFNGREIKNLIMGDGITSISDYLLQKNSSKIQNISIGKDVKRIGKYAFANNIYIKKIVLPNGVELLDENCFGGCQGLEYIELPKTLKTLGKSCFSTCVSLKEINLPEGLEVIGDEAFSFNKKIEFIEIPSTVISIGQFAFERCLNLTTIDFKGNSFSNIPYMMLSGCIGLTTLDIPEGVKNIADRAFYGCTRLNTVTIPKSVTYINSRAFENCENLETIKGYAPCSGAKHYVDTYNENNPDNQIDFESIGGENAHTWNEGYTVKNPTTTEEGVKRYTCQVCYEIKEEPIPKLSEQLKLTGKSMEWTGTNSAKIVCVSNKDGWYYVDWVTRGSEDPTFDLEKEGVPVQADREFTIYLADLDTEHAIDVYVRVKDKDNNISKKMLFQLDEKKRPTQTTSKIQVGDNIYATVEGDTLTLSGAGEPWEAAVSWSEINKNDIKKIIVEEGTTKLGEGLFSGFYNLEEVTLPTSLRKIEPYAFSNCWSLENIVIPEGVTTIAADSFRGCLSLKRISFPSTLNEIPQLGTLWSTEFGYQGGLPLEEILIAEGVKKIAREAFVDCSSLKHIELPDSINVIDGCAFSGCTSLESIKLPKELSELGESVFDGCSSLTTLVFPASLKTIPSLGVESGTGVTSVTIPEGIEVIGDSAFSGCESLKNIDLPDSVTSINTYAFADSGIENFVWSESVTTIPDGVFWGCKNLKEFSVPETVTEISSNAFRDCTSLEKITIPKSVTYIGYNVFYNCRNLTIYGYKDSIAEKYANSNNIPFVSADYKVVFKNNGRTVKTEYVLARGNATPPALTKEGYTLSWDGDYTDIQEDMIINAVWTKDAAIMPTPTPTPQPPVIVVPSEPTKYTVTFKDRGKVVKTEKVESGKAADYPYIQRNGYELTWDTDFSKVTKNITVNAVWTIIKPAKITGLTAEVSAKSIRLSWDESEYTGYYLVYRKVQSDKDYTQVAKTTKILWTDKAVKAGTEYQYKVIAVRSVDGKKYESESSDIVAAKIGEPVKGNTYAVGNLKYKVMSSNEVRVTGAAKNAAKISIPAVVSISGKSFKVTSVDHKAFYRNQDIVNVSIGNNVTYIGQYSFYRCPNLEKVKFGNKIKTISTCAFTECPNLGNVTLPASVERLGAKVFYHCSDLQVLTIKSSKLSYIGKKGLAITKTTTIKVPTAKYAAYKKMIKESVTFSKTKIQKM